MDITNSEQGMENTFDQPIQVQSEASDELIQYEDFFSSSNYNDEHEQAQSSENIDDNAAPVINFDDTDDEPNGNENHQNDNHNQINFEDDAAPAEEDDIFKEEEAIEKLKALGYDVKKDEPQNAFEAKQVQIQSIDQIISGLESYLGYDDIELCKQKAIEDLKAEYKKTGREGLINTEEFKLELESTIQEYEYNPRLTKLEANTIRNDINNYINQKKSEKQGIVAEVEREQAEKIKQNRLSLQNKMTSFANKNLFGNKVNEDIVKNSYKKIVSGDFAKKINEDQELQAEFAIYLELKDRGLISSSGKATYGEGVADAVNALNGNNVKTSVTPLDKTVSRPGAGNSIIDRIENEKFLAHAPLSPESTDERPLFYPVLPDCHGKPDKKHFY